MRVVVRRALKRPPSSPPSLQEWLEENPFTLALSSGFFGFFAHAGFVKALSENGLRPRAYAGASAGSIVASMAAVGMNAKDAVSKGLPRTGPHRLHLAPEILETVYRQTLERLRAPVNLGSKSP